MIDGVMPFIGFTAGCCGVIGAVYLFVTLLFNDDGDLQEAARRGWIEIDGKIYKLTERPID